MTAWRRVEPRSRDHPWLSLAAHTEQMPRQGDPVSNARRGRPAAASGDPQPGQRQMLPCQGGTRPSRRDGHGAQGPTIAVVNPGHGGELRRRAQRTVRALIPVFCPADADTEKFGDAIVHHVQLTVSALAPFTRRAFFMAVVLIETAGLRRGRLLSRLSLGTRRDCVERLRKSSPILRRLVGSVRDVIVIAYFDQPAVKDRLGYRPSAWTEAMKAARADRWAAAIAEHEVLLRAPSPRPPIRT